MKSFEALLNKRVKNSSKLSFDIHIIRQTTDLVIQDMFGDIGKKNIKIKDWKGGVIFLSVSKSVWRNEIVLLRGKMISEINKKIKQKVVKFIKINK